MSVTLTDINRAEVLQYLGWRGSEIPPEVSSQLDSCLTDTLSLAAPRIVWRAFQPETLPDGLLQGNDIRALLADCREYVLLAATIGSAIENAIRRAQVRGLTRALILDCCGSTAIEAVCDAAEEEIRTTLGAAYLTDRFSPGYGDLPLAVQPHFLAALDAERRIGLTLTPSGIMTPRKSVTAILGIADTPQPHRFRGCACCSMFETCTYRKAGKTCGRQ